MESNQIDILAFAVLGHFQQIDDAQKTGLPRQLRSDIRKADRLDGIHLDLAFFHTIPMTDDDVRTLPYPHAASNFSKSDSLAKALGKRHK